jgi:thiosulfate/3-mercaptopyruvate sulfurtransferase
LEYYVDLIWLKEHLDDHNVRIIDCRFKLGEPEAGENQYAHSHIPGAVYFDLEKDLSAPVEKHGGRHPLPVLSQLKARLEESGIVNDSIIVAYDNKEGAFASRFWWLLKYIGHEKVYILNGGFEAWTEAGYPVDGVVPQFRESNFSISEKAEMLASYEEVKDIALNVGKEVVLIDSREQRRYLGIEEPIDRVAGHIPSAINRPWMEGLENGFFKQKNEQKKRFADLEQDQSIIVYCGSGVTAIPNFIALKEAGYRNVRLYAGSYSDWISYDNPVEKGNEGS